MATRRRMVRSLAVVGLVGTAGCLDQISGGDSSADGGGSEDGLDSKNETAELESAQNRIDELEEELARTEASLIFEKYVYGYSLSLDADERYGTAVSAWDEGAFVDCHSSAERAWGIYSASSEAFAQCRTAAGEREYESATTAAGDALEYAESMTEAAAALATAAERAMAEEHVAADESRKTAQARADTARDLDVLQPSEFQELIGE